jgi:hypothetical protein
MTALDPLPELLKQLLTDFTAEDAEERREEFSRNYKD